MYGTSEVIAVQDAGSDVPVAAAPITSNGVPVVTAFRYTAMYADVDPVPVDLSKSGLDSLVVARFQKIQYRAEAPRVKGEPVMAVYPVMVTESSTSLTTPFTRKISPGSQVAGSVIVTSAPVEAAMAEAATNVGITVASVGGAKKLRTRTERIKAGE
ncbi:MAG: hypothetical protein ACREDF_05070, partial [Thermoplasmata archaeon]